MTTYVNFAPSNSSVPPFQFQATLDGTVYTVSTVWNFAAQRWYLSITDQSGNQIVTRPLIGSPAQTPITGLSWTNGVVTAVTAARLGFSLGSLVNISVAGALPIALSGAFPCTVIGANSFTYALATNPGQILTAGSWSIDQNLAGGYFTQSTLVYRAASNNFEIN
jgi:hypothetical protein